MSERNAAGEVVAADGGALVGVLVVGLWATPGWAKKPKGEKPKLIAGEIAGLLVAIEPEAA